MNKPRSLTTRLHPVAAALSILLCVLPAAAAQQPVPARSFTEMVKSMQLVPRGKHDSEMLARATVAVQAIQKMELDEAQQAINEALQLDARHSYLHFLNGFVYHLQAKQGDTQKAEIAIEGYQQALRIDPANWIAQEFLGLAYMDLKQFNRAKSQFTEVLLMTPDSALSIEGLMVSSYLTGDAATACAMADQYRQVSASPGAEFVRSSVPVYASCGDFAQAEQMRDTLRTVQGQVETDRLDRRLAQWKAVYRRQEGATLTPTGLTRDASASGAAPIQLAQAFTVPKIESRRPRAMDDTAPPTAAPVPAAATEAPAAPVLPAAATLAPAAAGSGPRMALIDVVLLSTQELISTSKGVNLLSALTLQLGGPNNLPGFSKNYTSEGSGGGPVTVLTRAINIPTLTYSLNIANANNSANEVLARPTLAAIEGMPSEFFSGVNLNAGVVSLSQQGGATIVPLDKRFGIKLAVTPTFLPDGQVQLKVDAQRTALQASSDNSRVAYQIEIAEITASANVVMKLGETLVLSGLSEKSSSRTRDGVPGLQDVPVVQYLFSNKRTNDVQRSVLILVTPRAPVQVAQDNGNSADNLATLRQKFGLPANVPQNVEAIMNQMKPSDFFREFRQGDVAMERWDHRQTTGERLREAMGFLYY